MILYKETFDATSLSVREHVERILVSLKENLVSEDQKTSAEIVLAELLNNIVEHGYVGISTGKIHVEITLLASILQIDTKDFGLPIADLRIPEPVEPDLNVQISNLPEGSFGWFMIRKLTCDSSYRRVGNTNCFSLSVAL